MVAYKVNLTPKAKENLKALDISMAQRVLEKIRWLSQNVENLHHKTLKGNYADIFKLRVGDWRVLYTIDYSTYTIIVRLIKHRRDVYKV